MGSAFAAHANPTNTYSGSHRQTRCCKARLFCRCVNVAGLGAMRRLRESSRADLPRFRSRNPC